ncbi:hypothetical protein BGI33_03790 [Snodgrassella alvi]|uniref:Uncharacterized protein n=1 Tax=Snodgrassella alvi TaxID=1196083 RepID=A0A2N9WQW9_9NEIS|nr:hypothetical protein BGI32_09770 [Snodgrassella alvi]PIT16476.1 hypothetical protein BGI33_03790 [Snodgrassella alvi]PIT18408.1 hypothetical protein BGI34_05300 [Snodgrassella alvi]
MQRINPIKGAGSIRIIIYAIAYLSNKNFITRWQLKTIFLFNSSNLFYADGFIKLIFMGICTKNFKFFICFSGLNQFCLYSFYL